MENAIHYRSVARWRYSVALEPHIEPCETSPSKVGVKDHPNTSRTNRPNQLRIKRWTLQFIPEGAKQRSALSR